MFENLHAPAATPASSDASLLRPAPEDAAAIRSLIGECRPLDVNSTYAYLLLAHYVGETCVIARSPQHLLGFVSGFRTPANPEALFIWQVAVHPEARGQSLGIRMITHLLERHDSAPIARIETTVSPSNTASLRMFESLARRLGASLRKRPLFSTRMFGAEQHEDENLLVIGPINSLEENQPNEPENI